MERPFVSCVPPAVSACSFGDFVICRLAKRILFYYFYVGDFNLRRFCEHIKCTNTNTHVPLSVSHTYTHTQAHTEKRQFHVQLLSRWHETTLKQEEARQQQRVWSGGGGRRVLRLGSASRAGKNRKTSRPATPWRAAGAAAVRSHHTPAPPRTVHVQVNSMCVWPVELTPWNSILQHSNCFQYNLLVRKINEHYLRELNPI